MKRLLRVTLPPLATLALGLFIGFAIGQRWGLQWVEPEVFGNLSLRVEAASRIRVGEPEVALGLIDGAIDRAVLFAAAHYDDLRPESRSSVRSAKLYRTVAPSTSPVAAEVDAFLALVPMPDKATSFCPPGAGGPTQPSALQRLVTAAGVEW